MGTVEQPISVIRTKLRRPPVPSDFVLRAELQERLRAAQAVPLTLVSAPTGYGKTTLVSHWLQHTRTPNAWLSLDETDSDLRVFVTYLVAAVQTAWRDACRDTWSVLQASPLAAVPTLAGTLSNDLDALGRSFVLALDDDHRIRSPAIHDLWDYLLERPPTGFRLVLLTRRDPSLSLGRLRARHEVVEIRMRDLQFSESEAASFLERAAGRRLDAPLVRRLHEHAEGWTAALRLGAVALQHRGDAQSLLHAATTDTH